MTDAKITIRLPSRYPAAENSNIRFIPIRSSKALPNSRVNAKPIKVAPMTSPTMEADRARSSASNPDLKIRSDYSRAPRNQGRS